jgi:hypothetical protein
LLKNVDIKIANEIIDVENKVIMTKKINVNWIV